MKITEREFGGNRKVAFILSWLRGELSGLVSQELCPPPHEEYTARAPSQEQERQDLDFFLSPCFRWVVWRLCDLL